ncbi:M3 family metallopeptidase [Permianibacter sp. IMCC34836]|uniref:M3 family metallopeptidase n=1 Tax=Permianibacter fluminis TaxID=2738515 RepID=UPI0015527B2C|nr:M3 family metallopeptidase [Permianibacter fluminis]NQD36100.1 M3 family metallopeptidase [Permianibacter fluminis]
MSPLPTELPRFTDVIPEQVVPELQQRLAHNRATLKQLLDGDQAFRWATLVTPLEASENELHKWWSRVGHLHSVCDSPALRDAYNNALPLLTEYSTELEQNEALYKAYLHIRDHDDSLDAAQRHIVNEAIRDFELSGIALPPEQKKRYADLQQQLSDLGSTFEQNVLDASMAWTRQFNGAEALAGLPESALANARETAKARDMEGYLITLEGPSYLAVMTYADDRALREEVYTAYCTRASDQGPQAGKFDNSKVIADTLAARHELAQLLGFADYAALSLTGKMAKSAEQVDHFLLDLATRARHQAQADLAELAAYAKAEHGCSDLQVWDIGYYSEKLRQHKYNISDEELRPYFPESTVLNGLFDVAWQLFGVRFAEQNEFDRWHPSVRLFDVKTEAGATIAHFYVDLHARQHKRGGAWMDDAQGRFRCAGTLQKPIAFLTCNFAGPAEGKPALLTHDDVVTLFHEFGHGLHHMLSEVDYLSATGIHGVEWDAVELPSQFMENFCWEKAALKKLSAHWQTGEALPDVLIDRLLAAKHFQSAMQMIRQIEFSLFDLRLHAHYQPGQTEVMTVLNGVREQVSVLKAPAFNRFPHSFGHIFAGGYAAGYYSYKWAEVLSADAFSKFEEDGVFERNSGERFRKEVLAVGGTRPALDSFKAFRGREPEIDALLRHNGIAA